MGLAISARWPLGSYLGHRADGTPEAFPMLPRLYSAFVASAATGSAAADGAGHPDFPALSPDSVEALRWLEEHDPSGMVLPGYPGLLPSDPSMQVMAYRKEGVFDKQIRFAGRVTDRRYADASCITAPITWIWHEDPPTPVLSQLDAIAADVGSLGEAESIVVVEVEAGADPSRCTHLLEETSFFDDRGDQVQIPGPGRLNALEAQFREANPAKRPTAARDRFSMTALPASEAPTSDGLLPRALTPVGAVEADVPWATVALLPVRSGPVIAPEDRVRVARDLHRALIACIGQKCPPVVTGHYLEGTEQPANRVALHYLPPGSPLDRGNPDLAHLLVMIPRGTAPAELDAVLSGLSRISHLRTPMGRLELDGLELADGGSFWKAPEEFVSREWRTDPVVIPERQSSAPSRELLLRRTAAWALGNVLRGLDADAAAPSPQGRLDWLQSHGGDVIEAQSYLTPRPARFVHRTNRAMPVMPFTARLDLGDLVPPTTLLAIGQSRHLGGGLLLPVDRRTASRRIDV